MRFIVEMAVTQTWRIAVDADTKSEACTKAHHIYDETANPWEDLEPAGEEERLILKAEEQF